MRSEKEIQVKIGQIRDQVEALANGVTEPTEKQKCEISGFVGAFMLGLWVLEMDEALDNIRDFASEKQRILSLKTQGGN